MITKRNAEPRFSRGRSPTAGMTLFEVVIAVAVFTIAILGLLSSLGNSVSLDAFAWETNKAIQAGKQKIEEMTAQAKTVSLDIVVSTYDYNSNGHNQYTIPELQADSNGNRMLVYASKRVGTLSSYCEVSVWLCWKGVRGDRVEVMKAIIVEKPT